MTNLFWKNFLLPPDTHNLRLILLFFPTRLTCCFSRLRTGITTVTVMIVIVIISIRTLVEGYQIKHKVLYYNWSYFIRLSLNHSVSAIETFRTYSGSVHHSSYWVQFPCNEIQNMNNLILPITEILYPLTKHLIAVSFKGSIVRDEDMDIKISMTEGRINSVGPILNSITRKLKSRAWKMNLIPKEWWI